MNKKLEKKFGLRKTAMMSLFEPMEYGYRCPKGHSAITWSEYKEHIWCYKCRKDYYYADCVLIDDMHNPNDLSKQPRIITGIKNYQKDGNIFNDIPEELLNKNKRT